MSSLSFQQAVKQQRRLRMAIAGPSGSGKTLTAIKIAHGLGLPFGIADTEHSSASLYSDQADFLTVSLAGDYHPDRYLEVIRAAEAAGLGTLIIDSLTHVWKGNRGFLNLVDEATKRHRGNGMMGWRDITPLWEGFLDGLLSTNLNLIVTLRSKQAYEVTEGSDGRKKVEKLGMEPQMRDGLEFEFDVVGEINMNHDFVVSKTRCFALADRVFPKAGADVAKILLDWMGSGEAVDVRQQSSFHDPSKEPATDEQRNELVNLGDALVLAEVVTVEQLGKAAGGVWPDVVATMNKGAVLGLRDRLAAKAAEQQAAA